MHAFLVDSDRSDLPFGLITYFFSVFQLSNSRHHEDAKNEGVKTIEGYRITKKKLLSFSVVSDKYDN